jgi:hypothetical protein
LRHSKRGSTEPIHPELPSQMPSSKYLFVKRLDCLAGEAEEGEGSAW